MDYQLNETQTCPTCQFTEKLKEWTFVEESFERILFCCPACKEKVTLSQLE